MNESFFQSNSSVSHVQDTEAESQVVWWTQVCQIVIGFIGMFGNLTCVIVLCRRYVRNNTNLLIVNQAVADGMASALLIAANVANIGGVRSSKKTAVGAVIYCKLWNSFSLVFGCFAISTFNLVALSIERYLAVVHPIWYPRYFKKRALWFLIVASWVLGPVFQIVSGILHHEISNGECLFERKHPEIMIILFFWEYFIPVCIMTFSFAAVILKFHRLNKVAIKRETEQLHRSRMFPIPKTSVADHSTAEHCDEGPENQPQTAQEELHRNSGGTSDCENRNIAGMSGIIRTHLQVPNADRRILSMDQPQSVDQLKGATTQGHIPVAQKRPLAGAKLQRRNTTKVLLAMYILYIICWSPNQWTFLSYNFGANVDTASSWYNFLIILANLNACINPFLFAFRLKVYRQECKVICQSCCDCLCT